MKNKSLNIIIFSILISCNLEAQIKSKVWYDGNARVLYYRDALQGKNLDLNDTVSTRSNGKGFSNTILNRLGDPYVSSRSSSIQKDDEGSGLGLGFFISKTLLERLGIKIIAYNRPPPETGAIVSVLIPTDKRL